MIRYEALKDKPKQLLALTGFTPEEFTALLPMFSKHFSLFVETKTLDGKERKKRQYTLYKNSCFSSTADMLLFILIYLRKAMTQDVLGAIFGMDRPVANKWVHLLLPIVNAALSDLGELPVREKELSVSDESCEASTVALRFLAFFFHDGVERPIQRPKDTAAQKAYYSGKKKHHSVKNNILINAESKVVFLTGSYAGRIHDKRIADLSGYSPPRGSVLYQDTGFQGFRCPDVEIIQPKKKPKGQDLTIEERARNREISSVRIRVEHAISGIKRFRIVKDKLRNTKDGFADFVMETCCGLHNFRLNFRPWKYPIPQD